MIEMISITIAMERTFMMIIKNINDNDRNDINDDSNDYTNNNNIMITELWSTTVITGMKCYPIKTKMYCRLFIPHSLPNDENILQHDQKIKHW